VGITDKGNDLDAHGTASFVYSERPPRKGRGRAGSF
jgi:hypothetical protein